MDREKRYQKVSKGSWRITLTRKQEKTTRSVESSAENGSPAAPSPLTPELIKRGVSSTTAEEITGSFGPDMISIKIDVFDWLTSKKDKRVSISPGGYLADSIRKNYAIPKGFQTAAQIAADAKAKQEAHQRKLEEARQKKKP
jgi:hypothetical protein